MKNAKYSRADFQQTLTDLNKKYEKVLQFLDQKESRAAIVTAEGIIKEVENVFSKVAEDYLGSLYSYKIPQLSSDQNLLTEWANQDKALPPEGDVIDVFARLEIVLQHLNSEVKRRYPTEPLWRKIIFRHRKSAIGILVGIIILGAGIYARRKIWINHHGLLGQYFDGINFDKQTEQRLDHVINFNWGWGSPFPNWNKDFFSVRWTGYLKIPKDARYEFVTNSDDGVRLWIDNQIVLENWTTHGVKTNRGGVFLPKGYHEIKMEYFEYNNPAVIRLSWKYSGRKTQIIPTRYLTPTKPD